jgi:four helix bundle protein
MRRNGEVRCGLGRYRGGMIDSRKLRVLDAAEDMAATVLTLVTRVDARLAPGVRGQLVRAATAVPANIAEAANLGTDPNVKRQLRLSLASANESASHLRVLHRARALDPLTIARCTAKVTVVCKMLASLIRAIEEREAHTEESKRHSRTNP